MVRREDPFSHQLGHVRPTRVTGVDETYIKVSGEQKYLYRAVDSTGQTAVELSEVQVPEYASQNDLWFVVPPVEGIVGLDRHPGGFSLPSVVQGFRNTTATRLHSLPGQGTTMDDS